jgi:hypothetical protein
MIAMAPSQKPELQPTAWLWALRSATLPSQALYVFPQGGRTPKMAAETTVSIPENDTLRFAPEAAEAATPSMCKSVTTQELDRLFGHDAVPLHIHMEPCESEPPANRSCCTFE